MPKHITSIEEVSEEGSEQESEDGLEQEEFLYEYAQKQRHAFYVSVVLVAMATIIGFLGFGIPGAFMGFAIGTFFSSFLANKYLYHSGTKPIEYIKSKTQISSKNETTEKEGHKPKNSSTATFYQKLKLKLRCQNDDAQNDIRTDEGAENNTLTAVVATSHFSDKGELSLAAQEGHHSSLPTNRP